MFALEISIVSHCNQVQTLSHKIFLSKAHDFKQNVSHSDSSPNAVAGGPIRPLQPLYSWEAGLDSLSLAASTNHRSHQRVSRHLF